MVELENMICVLTKIGLKSRKPGKKVVSLHVVHAAAEERGHLEAERGALAHQARHVPVVERPAFTAEPEL